MKDEERRGLGEPDGGKVGTQSEEVRALELELIQK